MGRRWAAGLVVGLVLAGTGMVELPVAQTNLARARRDQAAARADLGATTSQLDQVRADLAGVTDQRDRDRSAADRATSAASVLADIRTKMVTAQTALDGIKAESNQRADQVGALAACLGVLDGVRNQLAHGHASQAAIVLANGTDVCRFAEAVVGDTAAAYPFDFADPYVMATGAGYLAFATNGPAGVLQMLTSKDAVTWHVALAPLVGLPGWAEPGTTWAPAVSHTPAGYILYYSVRDRSSHQQCISTAVATAPEGPYTDVSAFPFICQGDHGGSIDASPFTGTDGNLYLTWKSEDDDNNGQSQIWTQQLGLDGQSLVGTSVSILAADQPWESHTIEGPSMVSIDGRYLLLYSGNRWGSGSYAVGYALCAGPLGPCAKPPHSMILATNDLFAGPGGAEFYRSGSGQLRVAFHAFAPDGVGYPSPRRLYTRAVVVAPGGGVILGQ